MRNLNLYFIHSVKNNKDIITFLIIVSFLVLTGSDFLRAQPGSNKNEISISKNYGDDEKIILTPKPSLKPRINGTSIFGVRPGSPFLFKIPATGERPIKFSVNGLPEGLNVNEHTGLITGSITQKGEYVVILIAVNSLGRAEKKIRIICGDQLALTPHMGWNHWYILDQSVTDQHIRQATDAMISNGMADHGYMYINIDDSWAFKPNLKDTLLSGKPRNENGRIKTSKKFPDMKALTDYIHSKGLKAGIYSSPGPLTCAEHSGSYHFEEADAVQYAEWGFDFLKYDLCSYRKFIDNKNIPELKRIYKLMSDNLKKQSRDIILNLCEYGWGNVWEWGKEIGGHSWRTAYDLGGKHSETAMKMYRDGFDLYADKELHKFGGPGGWNDPDYLLLGYISDWKGNQVPTPLTPNEQYTQVSFWTLIAAPLILSGDITRLGDFELNLLCNDEVIEVNQDPLGKPGRRVHKEGDWEVWGRDLEDGSKAVGLFNRGDKKTIVTANWFDLQLSGKCVVRDLWRQKDLGLFDGQFPVIVPPHGVVFVKIKPAF